MKLKTRNREIDPEADFDEVLDPLENRGESLRIIKVYRIARLSVDSDSGLSRIHDISNSGMTLVTSLDVSQGDSVVIALSDGIVLAGVVAWVLGARVGIHFIEEIDAATVLRSLAEKPSPQERPFRLSTNTVGVAVTSGGTKAIRVFDISQQGMKISHDGSLSPGERIKVALANGLERRGIVKWANDDLAGLRLLEPIAFHELETVNRL